MELKGRFRLRLNVRYEHRDKYGNLKPIFQENWLWHFLHKKFNFFAPQIPFLFGYWSNSKLISNLVTSAGQAAVAGLINGVITNFFEYIALGTGTNAAAAGDTALQTETSATGLARASATTSRVTTDVTNDTARLTYAFTNSSGGNVAVTEAGVLDSAAAGILLARQVFSAVNLADTDTFTPTWNFDVD